MSDQLRLERNLPGLLEDLYVAGTPKYRNDVLATVARTRQRPAWTFPERWIPMVDIATRPAFAPRVPVRPLLVLALLLALAVAAIAYIGSQQRELPDPFGPARNGLIVYSVDGDLFTVDGPTGQPRPLVSSPMFERQPVVSPDGTRVAFFRGEAQGAEDAFALVVIGIDGDREQVLEPADVGDVDAIAWSPDGTYLLRNTGGDEIVRYDLGTNERRVIAEYARFWASPFRPPMGDKLLYESTSGTRKLMLMNPDGTGSTLVHAIPDSERSDGCDFHTAAWSPDGTRIAFPRQPAGALEQCRIHVMNADGSADRQLSNATGTWVEMDIRWSPDSSAIAFNRWEKVAANNWAIRPIAIAPADGGATRSVGPVPISDGAAFEWSPDGTSIISVGGNVVSWAPLDTLQEAQPVLIDVASGESRVATWSMSSRPGWQRLAP